MSFPVDRDPPRWRDGRSSTTDDDATGAGEIEREIAAASRSVAAAPGPDELRLAHVRQRALQRVEQARLTRARGRGVLAVFASGSGAEWSRGRRLHWARLGALVFASLLVGGVATAVTGRLIQRYSAARAPSAAAAVQADDKGGTRRPRQRRWRVSVQSPTNLELAVGPDGAEIAVVEGQANMSGEGIADSVEVVPGKAWKEGQSPLPLPAAPPPPPLPVAAAPDAPAPVRTVARADVPVSKPRGTIAASRPPPSGLASPSSPPIVEAPAASPFEPPPLPPPALPLAPARAARIAPSRIWAGSDVEPAPAPSAKAAQVPVRSAPVSTTGEATLVARALGRLRRDHDPLWALQDLEEHARVFPRGALGREASLARAEALLALDRRPDALAILDGLHLTGAQTERSATLARAELRTQEGRHGEAIGDFDRVLAGSADDALSERALFGRGLCRLRGGDLGGARADLNAYLKRFPASHRRAEIENLLGRLAR